MTDTLLVLDAVVDGTGVVGDRALISNGSITAVGHEIDAPGAVVERRRGYLVPGFHDAHLHLGSITASTTGTSLDGATSIADVRARLTKRGVGDLVAVGFDETTFDVPTLPDRHQLDAMVEDRAVLVYRVCGHIAIANSAALERAGVSGRTEDPADGSFDRAPDGTLTGVLRESAIDVVAAAINDTQRAVHGSDLVATTQRLADLGLRSVTAMVPAGSPAWCGPDEELAMLVSNAEGLAVDVEAVLISATPEQLRSHAMQIGRTGHLRFRGWKGFADGSLGGHTASLLTPYADDPRTSGADREQTRFFREMIDATVALDGTAHIHAIGDAAVARVLSVFGEAISTGVPAERLFVEHASVLSPDLVETIAEMGVTASVQPAFVTSDARWLERRLGPERAAWAYPFRSLLDAGAKMVGGSDAPVERPEPLAGVRAAVDRGGFHPEQRLEPADALRLFATTGFEGGALVVDSDLEAFEVVA